MPRLRRIFSTSLKSSSSGRAGCLGWRGAMAFLLSAGADALDRRGSGAWLSGLLGRSALAERRSIPVTTNRTKARPATATPAHFSGEKRNDVAKPVMAEAISQIILIDPVR